MGEPQDTSASGPADLGAETLSDALPLRRAQPVARGTAIGRYVVIEAVGSGGMSTVYAAYDPELDRRVALKVMRATAEDSETVREGERGRLLREAQAMARLSHPNVVTVHDVGTFQDRVFLAMHFVDGETLTIWTRNARSWREIVEMYGYAGRGLVAAHEVGLVHRDFKPDNVLVDGERRVRVTDFGLARPIADALASESTSAPISLSISSSRLQRPITLAGSIMGTPAYMAPEQYLGRSVDARCDQFSFCVSLWEALVGERPFAGQTLGEVANAVTHGDVQPFPAKSPVPARIRRALVKGLSPRPDDRFASMGELLRELAPSRRRWPLALGLATAGVIAPVTMLAILGYGDDEAPCAQVTATFDPTWNAARREAIGTALATGASLDEAARTRSLALIDDYADRWRAGALDACTRNKVNATESDLAFEARSRCLHRRRADLERSLALVEHGSLASIDDALAGIHSLMPPEVCAETELLLRTTPPPDDPAIRAAIDELLTRMDRLDAALLRGEDNLGAEIEQLVLEARRTEWPPILAHAHILHAELLEVKGDLAGAEQALYDAAAAAAAGNDSDQLINAWSELTFLVGQMQGRVAEGLQLARVGELEVTRSGQSQRAIGLLVSKGAVYQAANDRERARETWQRALMMIDADSDPSTRAVLLNNLGIVELGEGRSIVALDHFREARDIFTELYGPTYTRLADHYLNMCEAHTQLGRFAEALAECRHARELADRPTGDRAASARVLHGLVVPTLGVGDLEAARDLADQAIVALRGAYGDRSYAHAAAEIARAQVAIYLGAPDDATRHALVGDEMLRELGPAFAGMRMMPQWLFGVIAFGEGDAATALARCTESIELAAGNFGDEHPVLLDPLACRGAALAALSRHAEARAPLERAIASYERVGGDPLAVSHARFALAEVELATSGDRSRARELVQQARRDLDPVNPRVEGYARVLDAWLEAHP